MRVVQTADMTEEPWLLDSRPRRARSHWIAVMYYVVSCYDGAASGFAPMHDFTKIMLNSCGMKKEVLRSMRMRIHAA